MSHCTSLTRPIGQPWLTPKGKHRLLRLQTFMGFSEKKENKSGSQTGSDIDEVPGPGSDK